MNYTHLLYELLNLERIEGVGLFYFMLCGGDLQKHKPTTQLISSLQRLEAHLRLNNLGYSTFFHYDSFVVTGELPSGLSEPRQCGSVGVRQVPEGESWSPSILVL